VNASANTEARHVFISYRRSDAAVVEDLVAALGEAYPSWRDTARILGGQRWRETIVRAIDAAYAFILVVSPETERSKEVYAEYFYALGRGVPVIPVLISECALPFGQESVHARLWCRDRDQALGELKADLVHYRARAPSVEALSDEHAFLRALQLDYLLHVENYTRMAGVAHRRLRRAAVRPRAVVMRPEFALRRRGPLFESREAAAEERPYDDLLPALHELRRALILGEPGIGKTTTLYKFADELRQAVLEDPSAPLPVIVPLRDWRGEPAWEGFVAEHLGGLAGHYPELLKNDRLCLLLDGLNEIPRDSHRPAKLEALRRLLDLGHPMVVTCRELDYRDGALRLDLDTITIRLLDPERILEFLRTYLVNAFGETAGAGQAEALFWQIAGGYAVRGVWEKWCAAGAGLNLFFQAPDIPKASPDVYATTSTDDDRVWREKVRTPGNLVHLAANPYLLWMFLNIHLELGSVPANRGALFDEFVFQLLRREGLTAADALSPEGEALAEALGALAWHLQTEPATSSEPGSGVALTLTRGDALHLLGEEERLYRAAFAARYLLREIHGGLDARVLWPEAEWWEPTGWEEVTVLAAGMSEGEARTVLGWVRDANPEVAAQCARESGADVDDATLLDWRAAWLPRLTNIEGEPTPEARAAVGRALGRLTVQDAPLDNRKGVSVRRDTTTGLWLPDIDWVKVPGGEFLYQDGEHVTLPTFHLARYPVTHVQFQAFINDPAGYRNGEWWTSLEQADAPDEPRWSYANHPRETVSWYEAMAFCNWLSKRLGYPVSLPTEQQWEKAARGTDARIYPWGEDYQPGCANVDETYHEDGPHNLGQTSAVGIYPQGASPYGLLDMAGNVWEWCLNKYDEPGVTQPDSSGDWRVLRGGSWLSNAVSARADFRLNDHPLNRVDDVGFRVCCASPIGWTAGQRNTDR
jgi:formylglycine-generating enzyme required for sulfatase activity